MTTTRSTVSAPSPTPSAGGGWPEQAGPVFRIRYGRLALALTGLLCLLTGVVSAVLRVFAIGSGWLPAVTLLGAVCSVMLLRRLAVRDRRRKVDEAFRSAMSAPGSAPAEATRAPVVPPEYVQRPDSPLFDAEATAAAPVPAPERLTAMELRKAALAEAVASGDLAASLAQGTESSVAGDTSWEPVEVPKPTYVEAAKAERAAPEPLDLPEAPKAVGKPLLRQGATQTAVAASAKLSDDDDVKAVGKGQRALSNLDDVLQRRRA